MRVAVVGGGISGLASAYVLAKEGVNVTLYEKEDYLGGHAKTVNVDGIDLDLGFMLFNPATYPDMIEFLESLGIDMELSELSFAVSLDGGHGCEWGSRNGLSSLFAQKMNVFNPYFWQMIREIIKFKDDVISYLDMVDNNLNMDHNETLEQFIKSNGYSELFVKAYLIPICGSIWPCSSERALSFSAFSVLSFCRNFQHLQLFGKSQWLTVKGGSHAYVEKVKEELVSRGVQVITNCEVELVSTLEKGCLVQCKDGSEQTYESCIVATHAPDTLRLLGDEATYDERRILGAFQYVYSDIFLHHDKNLMPQKPAAWSAINFLGCKNNRVCVTYWLNILQNFGETKLPFLVTLNPEQTPKIPCLSGCGFHEDGLKAGMVAAYGILGRCCSLRTNPKHMELSWKELGARHFVTRFLSSYITTGCLTLLEDGGTMYTFEGNNMKNSLKCVVRIHSPQFYWKIMTQADLGLADAYINGDFSLDDKDEGLLNLFMIFIKASIDSTNGSNSKLKRKRGWWTPIFLTASLASAKFFFKHYFRKNSLTQARRNISRHYDLSNELFALFLDETMTYSCAVFKNEDEDLKDAQMRKMSLLIEKARIDSTHEVLDIGCGWGSFVIEVVKRTGCKCTGITLSMEQLKLAEKRVRDAGLQDHIKLLLCDYRQLPKTFKYDRIISVGMIEAVGDEYMEEFFGCCESVLADDGLLVLQFISYPDESYNEYKRSSGFIKEYIFPGGCLPSLSRVTSAMATASSLCVEHAENIGIHYHQTLRWWRKNFMRKHSEILALGFDEKFIRTWEYYFDYCAAGFKSRTLGDYQMVFSRPGNTNTLKDPYRSWPSAC
ncbi:Tuberculostearic acid methyltransferase [Arachis hypogaea]|uniref:Tuberculostearic acid methyltransferase n=1 Tax=Arachis hypogaea TaxID=3818 RepID=A0A6B9VCG9_ARAHY|nr:Tuberculostearic acid methyltransferase [Arachis hypogaea]